MVGPESGSIHVLHVDDEPGLAEMTGEFLSRQSERIDVETATSAGEGLDLLRENRFDCVVSDFDMPGKNGIEFLEAVREDDPDLPFVLYTGKGSEEVASEAISAGVTEYLQKERGTSQYDVLANRIVNAVEKRRAQDELQDREQRLNLFFQQSPLGVIRWDDEFNFARLNDTARDILGYEEGELVGQPWEVVVPEADREEIGEVVVADLLADEGGYHSVNENVWKDDERIVCEWHNWVVTDEDDEVVTVFSQFQDVTERKESERKLGELERYNRELVENAPVGLFRLDDRMRIRYENRRAEEIVGVPEGEAGSPALGRDVRELPSVQDTGAVEALNRLATGETVSFDTAFESIFGKESYLIGKGVPLFDDGAFDGAIVMVADITERKETEQILEQLRRNITDVVWMTTPEKDSMDFISDSYEDVVGRSVESLREDPTSFVDAIHPEDRARVRAALEDQQENPDAYEETYRVIRPDGELRWVHDRSSGVYEDGELTRVIGIASDVTERREREQELERQNERLDEFASVVSHDLRSPLSVAQGHLELAVEECDSGALESIAEAHARMETLVDHTLSLARAGETIGETATVELPALVEASWRNLETGSATLLTETTAHVRADESRLLQLFENVFRNAVEHGGAEPTVTVGDLPGGFYVEDDGPGIPEDEREDVLRPGYSSTAAGTGFGLSIVREVGEAHGWEVEVTSGTDGGARFEFRGVERE